MIEELRSMLRDLINMQSRYNSAISCGQIKRADVVARCLTEMESAICAFVESRLEYDSERMGWLEGQLEKNETK